MKKSSVPANATDRLVQFRARDAQRIASVVREVESSRRQPKGSRLPRAVGSGSGGGDIQEATFCGAWPKGQKKTVTLGVGGSSTSTASAINWQFSIPPHDTGGENYSRLCMVLMDGEIAAANTCDCSLVSVEF